MKKSPPKPAPDVEERSRKLDEILSKRPVSSGAPRGRALPSVRPTNGEVGMARLKQKGRTDIVTEMAERDRKLQAFMARAGLASPMTASPVHSPTALMAKTMTPLSGQPSLPASFGITSLAGPKISVDIQQVQRARNTASALNSPLSATASSPLLEATVEPVLLQNNWDVFYDRRGLVGKSQSHGDNYENNLIHISTFDTVQAFWNVFNHLKLPVDLDMNCNLHIFKHGIKPIWEDPQNKNGGKWTITFPTTGGLARYELINESWMRCCLAVIGELLDDDGREICGVVYSKRGKGDRIALWFRSASPPSLHFEIGQRLLQHLKLIDQPLIGMDFQMHSDSMKTGSSYAQNGTGGPAGQKMTLESLRAYMKKRGSRVEASGGAVTTGSDGHVVTGK